MDINVNEYVGENIHRYDSKTVRLFAFYAEIEKGSIILKDHDMYKCVDLDELKDFPLAPADVPIIVKLLKDQY